MMREHLAPHARHVDAGGALRLARLAAEAEIERLEKRWIVEATGKEFAAQGLVQQSRSAARRVTLIARGHEARAHRARVELAALAHADAVQRRARERCEAGMALVRRGRVHRLEIALGRARVDLLAGIHEAMRIPDASHLAHGIEEFRSEHLLKERAARLAVAMLA